MADDPAYDLDALDREVIALLEDATARRSAEQAEAERTDLPKDAAARARRKAKHPLGVSTTDERLLEALDKSLHEFEAMALPYRQKLAPIEKAIELTELKLRLAKQDRDREMLERLEVRADTPYARFVIRLLKAGAAEKHFELRNPMALEMIASLMRHLTSPTRSADRDRWAEEFLYWYIVLRQQEPSSGRRPLERGDGAIVPLKPIHSYHDWQPDGEEPLPAQYWSGITDFGDLPFAFDYRHVQNDIECRIAQMQLPPADSLFTLSRFDPGFAAVEPPGELGESKTFDWIEAYLTTQNSGGRVPWRQVVVWSFLLHVRLLRRHEAERLYDLSWFTGLDMPCYATGPLVLRRLVRTS